LIIQMIFITIPYCARFSLLKIQMNVNMPILLILQSMAGSHDLLMCPWLMVLNKGLN
jgi:hypothetical protein